MAEFNFPELRFIQAGVPLIQVDKMRREFAASDLTIQRSLCEFWSDKSQGALRDYATRYATVGEAEAPSESPESALDSPESDANDEGAHVDIDERDEASANDEG